LHGATVSGDIAIFEKSNDGGARESKYACEGAIDSLAFNALGDAEGS
jgi:hypothetical protein